MDSAQHARRLICAGIAMMAGSATVRADDGDSGGFLSDFWRRATFVTTIRSDSAYKTTGIQNYDNQGNAPFQHIAVPRQAYVPPALSSRLLGVQLLPAATNWNTPIPNSAGLIHTNDTVRRDTYIQNGDTDMNYQEFRVQNEINLSFTDNFRLNIQTRAIFDPDIYTSFDAKSVRNFQGGIADGGGDRYADLKTPQYFQSLGRNGGKLNPTEFAGRQYMVDFPTALLEYKHDAFNIRFGLQQIAWGQAIFFQSFDVPDGLDFRRHLVIDRAIEEFSDKRVPSLALRGTLQASDAIIVDGYVQKFQPSVIPNPNTPYNVAPAQFYKPLDNYYTGGYDSKLGFGVRMKADYGNWGFSALAGSRYNPLGVFSWAESGINKGLTGTNPNGTRFGNDLGAGVEAAYASKAPNCAPALYNPTTCRLYGSLGEALSHTPFTIGPGGVYSNKEWFSAAGSLRLDGLKALNTVIDEYPALRDAYASHVDNVQEASNLLNTFFTASDGSIRGNVMRDYYREEVFGIGGSYVNETENINSFWNQFITNVELQYTPNRRLTAVDLAHGGQKTDEFILSVVGERWYRFTPAFPAAYLAFEYQHRTASDLVGLTLKGYGGNSGNYKVNAPVAGQGNDYSGIKTPKGITNVGANYLVFAGFLPAPNRKFVLEWAFLYDVQGGLLAQPLLKWNPGHNLSVDFFYNYVNGHLYGNPTNNLVRAIDFANEVNIRIGYQI